MESSDRDMYRQFQDWCLRTYGDSGKTKTVTRKKYDRIVQLLNGSESSSTDNAKFKFWVKSKGFQLGNSDEDGVGVDEKLSLRRVAVVEDFFDIIYSMHVETGPNGEQIRKHAGQKRTYKAISETYAFLPREAVTRFLMSCSECQKRMHLNPDGADHKDNGKPPTLVTSMIDYNMPITMAYMKHMKLQLLNSQQDEDESSIESDEFDMSDSTRMSAVNSDLSSNLEERMQSPQNLQGQQDDDSAAESFNGNETVGHSSNASGGTHCREMAETNSNGKTNLEQDEQPLNLSDSPLSAQLTSEYRLDDHSSNGKNKYKTLLISDLKMEREARENGSKSPAHSYSSYDSGKNESVGRGAEDLSLNRGDEDEDDHDEQEDPEKVNESDGVEAERLKAFNMFVRLFVDENLDRMVPISKQPKEKIQAIIDSCRRQFPEYQERARKRIRTYLKSCRRMKRSGFEMSRPIPSHLTSAVAESILASACESESRNAAKRMRLDRQQDEAAPADKQYKQEPAQVTYSTSAVSSTQEVLYINGNGTYSYHSYRGLGGGLLNLNDASSSDLQPTSTTATTQHCIPGTTNVQSPSSSGPTDLSMKRQLATSSGSSSSSSSRPQLSPTEINAVRQLVAGYRESAAFLLRSADELENLILQQN
ncbi:nucleolar protein 4 isoform X2 [Falco biarmicus]|uniref:nucleolar protein 4 isoform X2 n=1 Tax=Falco peregrinus TaxID=8954 RepID=UPI000FFC2DAE|nr:nucleolar protein 4 isoform X2 [Falco peregrinus]XP_032856989.1 nucleolar protein 4 isoform X2 [Tyto alba]XP_037237194.1 nucleolar protein 4 isoform X2 [Falco rusticolus]XP_040443885.1 nucleolar protein 4 isoform X2 [Falco naumanni]XP_055561966.1 nucleolar protein 4 isoform X2 [Falco cherrug]XP_056189126.1 nucleolar protein 4 isoform X2 [Falco biarmicus]